MLREFHVLLTETMNIFCTEKTTKRHTQTLLRTKIKCKQKLKCKKKCIYLIHNCVLLLSINSCVLCEDVFLFY